MLDNLNAPYQGAMIDMSEIRSPEEWAYDGLLERIRDFEAGLTDDQETGIVTAGGMTTIHVETLSRSDQMLAFDGVDDEGRRSRLIQHYTQTSIQLVAVGKLDKEPRRIGF